MNDKQLKAYVIKNRNGEYLDEDRDFIDGIENADIFYYDDELAKICCPVDCKIIPITIQEGESNEAVEALAELSRRLYESHYHEESDNRYSVYMEEIESVIDQLIKEYGGNNNAN